MHLFSHKVSVLKAVFFCTLEVATFACATSEVIISLITVPNTEKSTGKWRRAKRLKTTIHYGTG